MIKTLQFEDEIYPHFQSTGNAAKFAIPFALEVCKGRGLDIGCNRPEWAFPGSFHVDPLLTPQYNAMNLPGEKWDYIFSSHMLEHVDRWVDVLDYWYSKLGDGGVLFLYLPHPDQKYWRNWNNRKHINMFTPEIIQWYLESKFRNVFVSQRDLNHSFMAMGEK